LSLTILYKDGKHGKFEKEKAKNEGKMVEINSLSLGDLFRLKYKRRSRKIRLQWPWYFGHLGWFVEWFLHHHPEILRRENRKVEYAEEIVSF